mmetsp:Transcript_29042/g.53446  ORF Transcript_29042/g.53446 Transcript_29042/m.53446 type:complete len:293 (+) Transcript_29042:78-956(+)
MEPTNYGSVESCDKTEQPLEYAGVFGGHGCTMCFFAVFEGFTCCWLLLVIFAMFAQHMPVLLVMVLFGCFFHCVTQCMLTCMDPGNVGATLDSLESGMEDERTAAVFEELREIPATVKVVAEAYHTETEGIGNDTRTKTVIDHREEANFPYVSWKDASGCVVGLEKHQVCAVEVVPKIEFADAATAASYQSLKERLLSICRRHRRSVSSSQIVSLKHPKYEVNGSRVFVTRSAGVDHASWMNKNTYTACRFACPCFGTIYRTLFFISISNARYTITKRISTSKKAGSEWIEV